MTNHKVTGGGGTRIHLAETGNGSGPSVIFIHGFSQSSLVWRRQLDSDLASDYRLFAMDMRGHGSSDKPVEGYGDSRLWAEDVHAAIQTLGLERPVLCGWSYGPLVILDYIRHYGDDAIAGICLVGGVTKLGSDEAAAVLTPDFLGLVPGFFASDVETCVGSLRSLLELCIHEPSPEDLYMMLGASVCVPPYVRRALLSRSINNDDLLPRIQKRMLAVHASDDAVVKPDAVKQHMGGFTNAQVELLPNAGHAVFWNDAATFNRLLREFLKVLAADRQRITRSADA